MSSAARRPPHKIETTVWREPKSDAVPTYTNIENVRLTAKARRGLLFFQMKSGMKEKNTALVRRAATLAGVIRFKFPPWFLAGRSNDYMVVMAPSLAELTLAAYLAKTPRW